MVTLGRIYTRGGDHGQTSLATGERVAKTAPLIGALGDLDELMAQIGFVLAALPRAAAHAQRPQGGEGVEGVEGDLEDALLRVLHDLFDLGADLAVPLPDSKARLRITSAHVTRLEQEIDAMNADLPTLTSFVLPQGSELTVRVHLARAVCRRTERAVLRVGTETISSLCGVYLNRLSDWLFVAARTTQHNPLLWEPGKNI